MEKLLPGGWPAIRAINHRLVARARTLLCHKLELDSPCPLSLLGSMATLPLPERFQGRLKSGKIDLEQCRLYDQFGIEIPFYRFGQPEKRWFRISAQLYNSIADYEFLAQALACLKI
jgi:isopenicillin-N epimerase